MGSLDVLTSQMHDRADVRRTRGSVRASRRLSLAWARGSSSSTARATVSLSTTSLARRSARERPAVALSAAAGPLPAGWMRSGCRGSVVSFAGGSARGGDASAAREFVAAGVRRIACCQHADAGLPVSPRGSRARREVQAISDPCRVTPGTLALRPCAGPPSSPTADGSLRRRLTPSHAWSRHAGAPSRST